MVDEIHSQIPDSDPGETSEWLEALDQLVESDGEARSRYLLRHLLKRAREQNIGLPTLIRSPYINTIPPADEPDFPGDEAIESRLRHMIRWNAVAMVSRANHRYDGLGGHLATYASCATLYEVGFNHFFRGKDRPGGGDHLYIQGHAAPGIYARAFLEGRLNEEQLNHYRREVSGPGLSSYPHPWLMPDFWEHPTVSMGLGPIAAIYQARFNRYLHNRGIKDTSQNRVWAFLGDGECDEPESLGALHVAAHEGLDNLIFVVSCNLQRLDGPVRGNGKIIQELEAGFRGAGWHVIKCIWSEEWDPLLAADTDGLLVRRMNEVVDGEYQKFVAESAEYVRENFFGTSPELKQRVAHMSDADIKRLRRGGHSHRKLYAAYKAATEVQGRPVVILAKTVKGWKLGKGFESQNPAHQMKKLNVEQLKKFRDRLELDISDTVLDQGEAPYHHPGDDSAEVRYLKERRAALGGPLPKRMVQGSDLHSPASDLFAEFLEAAKGGVKISTTMVLVRMLRKLLKDKTFGPRVVPIIPDEGRTFGMESMFREVGIYAPFGQRYDPVDSSMFLYYKESADGQILEEGITEAGSMASFTAAGTAYACHGVTMVPFYIFYSMFGFQRTQDQIWAFGDSRGKGFLCGATAGRTTLNGEGLQHEDGHSLLQAINVPNCVAYDAAYAYELAIIVQDGLRRMVDEQEDVFYYLTLYNENLDMPALPSGKSIESDILKGAYCLKSAPRSKTHRATLLGSGPLVQAALKAQQLLADEYDVGATVYSVTSYNELYREARRAERSHRLNPQKKRPKTHLDKLFGGKEGPIVATSDWTAELPSLLGRFVEQRLVALGTNGFGRSDTREVLRRHFEIDAEHMVVATLYGLMLDGEIEGEVVQAAIKKYNIDPEALDPAVA